MENIERTIKHLMRIWAEEKGKKNIEKIRYAGPSIGPDEYEAMMEAIFNDWWSGGKYTIEAEKKLATMALRNHGLLTNSGSSANLVLMSAAKELYFKDGDKIITLACGFPTTINPIIQCGLIPVLVDISLDNFGLSPELFESAIRSDGRIKGAFIPHHLGFPNKIDEILDIARKHNILVFFDGCDAYNSTYKGKPIQQYGKASTYSFYVAHHITMGEGGGVVTNDNELYLTMRGMRNWGRYCASNNCCIRSINKEAICPSEKFTNNPDLPSDYMVNYVYEWMGYNLKPLELQSAILLKQLGRIKEFDETRIRNYKDIYNGVNSSKHNIKTWELPEGVSPFAFPMLLPINTQFKRQHMINYFKRNGVESRLLFSGNITRHPAYVNKPGSWEVFGSLENSDNIMNNFIMVGVSQVLTKENISKLVLTINNFLEEWK